MKESPTGEGDVSTGNLFFFSGSLGFGGVDSAGRSGFATELVRVFVSSGEIIGNLTVIVARVVPSTTSPWNRDDS